MCGSPIMDEAITSLASAPRKGAKSPASGLGGDSDDWRTMLGANDGEEISTKLMLAAIDVLRRDLSADARRNWARKAVLSSLNQTDRATANIKRTMQLLEKSGQIAEGGGLRFAPNETEAASAKELQKKGAILRPRTSVVPYSGLDAVVEADKARGSRGVGKRKTSAAALGRPVGASAGPLSPVAESSSGLEDTDTFNDADDKAVGIRDETRAAERVTVGPARGSNQGPSLPQLPFADEVTEEQGSNDEDEDEDEDEDDGEEDVDDEGEALLAAMLAPSTTARVTGSGQQ